ncbi:hypothetical protein NONO_c38990 [Nocardia nova SH22a]|uniref:Uncharacterized protein n=1 Tax=Nocardia nova SH22a TaxID=1415166 RepID=W5TI51_9NOCA|nr:hypothetical protein NONO_c38990 [Nocardia nova SH22a]
MCVTLPLVLLIAGLIVFTVAVLRVPLRGERRREDDRR